MRIEFKNQEELVRAYRRTFSTPEDKAVLADILSNLCKIDGRMFSADPYITANRCGRREVGIDLMAILETTTVQLTEELKGTDNDGNSDSNSDQPK